MSEYREFGEENMTDYQFKYIMELKDDNAALKKEIAILRSEHGANRETEMTDFQFKKLIAMIYEIVKANFEAGKSPEEILKIIADLKNEPKDK